MANSLVEYILTSIKTLITTGLQTQLTALQAAYADGITLTAPISTAYYTNEMLAIDYLPAVQILPGMSVVETPGLSWDIMDHEIVVIAHTDGLEGDSEKCAKRTYRYAEALRNIILANRTPTNMIEFWLESIDYKPMWTDGNILKGEVWMNCKAKRREA